MKQSYFSTVAFLGIALVTTSFQCKKDFSNYPRPIYNYTEKLTLTPYKKTYAVYDTIWLQFQTADKTLFDKLSGSRIATDTTCLYAYFNFHRRYPLGGATELFSGAKVENGLEVGFTPSSNAYNLLTFKTDCSNSRYFFRTAFVPKQTGIYSIEPNVDVLPCPNKLSYLYNPFKFTFDLADCNKDIWLSTLSLTKDTQSGYTGTGIDRKELFIFKVE